MILFFNSLSQMAMSEIRNKPSDHKHQLYIPIINPLLITYLIVLFLNLRINIQFWYRLDENNYKP